MADLLAIADQLIEATRRHLDQLLVLRAALAGEAEQNTLAQLRQACADLAIPLLFNETVTEADAARLLCRSRLTLRNRRLADQPIPFAKIGGRVSYRLIDLAAYLDCEREKTC
ncbi:hypothetical protein [Mesorhizobium sp. M0244]|uniref:hypothetical protein n=1 Tax=Mesorhizobium sp. M0244 TaxID=2956926 RepID=UPI003335DA62